MGRDNKKKYAKILILCIINAQCLVSQVRVWDARGGEKSGLAHVVPAHVQPNGSGAVGDIVLTGDRAESKVVTALCVCVCVCVCMCVCVYNLLYEYVCMYI
jgi:hypothetical protein